MKKLLFVFVLFFSSCLTPVSSIEKPPKATMIPDRSRVPTLKLNVYYDHKGEKQGLCSAVMVGPRIAITAAHCVFHPEDLIPAVGVVASPLYEWGYAPFGEIQSRIILKESCFEEAWGPFPTNATCDFAIIVLEEPIGKIIGWLEPSVLQDDSILSAQGYPGGAPKILDDSGLFDLKNEMLESKTFAIPGMSGGPIYDPATRKVYGLITLTSQLGSIGVAITPKRVKALKDIENMLETEALKLSSN
jgi:V8-like Glu-specific endopeptidase